MENIKINTEYIKLDQLLKWAGEAGSGAEAKSMIEEGKITINGDLETRRGRKIRPGDVVSIKEKEFLICR
ncbi:MAG: S4 domain-containing protein YaaA [Clostridia bacterium]|jgi:ribosome-associated protein